MNKTLRIGAFVLGTTGALALIGSTAGASTPPTLQQVQAKATSAITLRVNDLNDAISKVDDSTVLGSDGAALASHLGTDSAPLQSLGQEIAADTSESTAAQQYQTIFTNYRVLALVLPAAHLAAAADGIDVTVLPRLIADSQNAQSKLTPTNQAQLQPLITDLNNQIANATSVTSDLASSVMSDTASDWNSNNDLLADAHGSLMAAQNNISRARHDVKAIVALLKSQASAAATASPTTNTTGS